MNCRQLEIKKLGAAVQDVRLSLEEARLAVQNGTLDAIDWCREAGWSQWQSVGEHPALCEYVPHVQDSSDSDVLDPMASIIPMSDVAFLLLIYFVVNFTVAAMASIRVPKDSDRPENTESQDAQPSFGGRPQPKPFRLVLRVSADGRYSVDSVATSPTPYTPTALRSLLQKAVSTTGAQEMVIVHAPDTRYEHVVRAMDAGFSVTGLKTSWERDTGQP